MRTASAASPRVAHRPRMKPRSPGPPRAWPSCRCRWPRWARRRRPPARPRLATSRARRSTWPDLGLGLAGLALLQRLAAAEIGGAPCRGGAHLLPRSASVSPKYWRRSECPRITYGTPSSRSIAGETSPVKAPSSRRQCLGADRDVGAGALGERRLRAVNGGQTTTSRSATPLHQRHELAADTPSSRRASCASSSCRRSAGLRPRRRAAPTVHSASTPGSVLPSRNSSEAPPPVETCVMLPSSPNRRAAATVSPPPTT